MMGLTFSPRCFARPKQWAVEVDYFNKLSPTDRQWLIKFQSEFHDGRVKKGDRQAFHRKQGDRRACYQRSNLANRDTFAIAYSCLFLSDQVDLSERVSPEESIISAIDSLRYENAGLVARAFAVLDHWRGDNGKELEEMG